MTYFYKTMKSPVGELKLVAGDKRAGGNSLGERQSAARIGWPLI